MSEITTCARSLTMAGHCCHFNCLHRPTTAALDDAMVEHTWCDFHVDQANVYGDPVLLAIKPLEWNPLWAPPTAEQPVVRRCRVCGCTDDRACPGGCFWVGPALCSRCQS